MQHPAPLKKPSPRKPEWLKIRPPAGDEYTRLKGMFRALKLHTVCEEARCPNVSECWGGGTATLMLMGDTCTRGCRFCNVKTGNPRGVLDELEPIKVASAISQMDLNYVVLTSVDRDDLPDGGADHFARTVEALKKRSPRTYVEVLIPDFKGDRAALERLVAARPDVIAHNLETVKRLTPTVRDKRATYEQSLNVLREVKEIDPERYTKSSLMVGLGESVDEVYEAMQDLRAVGCDVLTFGQYLQPTQRHLPVVQYLSPDEFESYRLSAVGLGFLYVASGPLVRSSYKAGEMFMEGYLRSQETVEQWK
ncbi:MAG: lipoyl synthase [Bdellovibrionales bacterium]|nr:lipoyl synthase [Bdellovibrionales bacterium]